MPPYPYLSDATLYPAADATPIALDTEAWHAWVDAHTRFTYQHPTLGFLVRREARPGGTYWYAYRRGAGKLRKRYLGRGRDITALRLQEVGCALVAPAAPAAPPEDDALLATRLSLPPAGRAPVPRPTALARFQHAITHPCTVVAAPAGFGKTTLVTLGCAPLRAQGWQIAWLALETSEREPARFWRAALTAIEQATPRAHGGALRGLVRWESDDPAARLTPLITALRALRAPFLLVFDDYHLVASPTLDTDLHFVIEHMPPALHLVVCGRATPHIPLARLQMQGWLATIGADDLRFSLAETAAFFAHTLPLPLSAEQVATLWARSEGWVAGLQLAAAALARESDLAMGVTQFAGSTRAVEAYLDDTVFHALPLDIQDFLLRTAILARFCAPLADALRAAPPAASAAPPSAQQIIGDLEQANLFLVTLDEAQVWYRYHHLFADMLRARLARQNPALLASCHAAAARWLADHDDRAAAIPHALAASDAALAAELLLSTSELLIQRGELDRWLSWATALPVATRIAHPRLALITIIARLMQGAVTAADAELHQLEASLAGQPVPTPVAGELAVAQAYRTLLAGGDLRETARLAQEALRCLEPTAGFAYGLAALIQQAVGTLFQDTPGEAVYRLSEIARTSIQQGNLLLACFALENRAIKEIGLGWLTHAERTCREALRMLAAAHPSELPYTSLATLRLGELAREQNQLAQARALLEAGLAQAGPLRATDLLVDGMLALVRVYDLLGERVRADTLLQELEHAIQSRPATLHTQLQVEALRALLDQAWGQRAAALGWATDYARRAPQYRQQLPAALSLPSDCALARLWITEGAHEAACQLLAPMLAAAQRAGRLRDQIELAILLARAEQGRHRPATAQAWLADALAWAAPTGFVRLFLDEGPPMADLLRARCAADPGTDARADGATGYARLLLDQLMPAGRADELAPGPDTPSERELQILGLVAAGHANAAIAAALMLAPSTVKWHLFQLYRKLGVRTRVQALAAARARGFLDP